MMHYTISGIRIARKKRRPAEGGYYDSLSIRNSNSDAYPLPYRQVKKRGILWAHHSLSNSICSRFNGDLYIDHYSPVRKITGALFEFNPADCFDSMQKRGEILHSNFRLDKFSCVPTLPLDDAAVDLAEAFFDLDRKSVV